MNCDRCSKKTISWTMSRFNTEDICPLCEAHEVAHPQYEEARRVELEHVKRGNYNFPGIGKPADL